MPAHKDKPEKKKKTAGLTIPKPKRAVGKRIVAKGDKRPKAKRKAKPKTKRMGKR